MNSRAQTGDAANSSFGAAKPKLQDVRPGVEPATPEQRALAAGSYRRVPSEDNYIDRAPLAERIRGQRGY